MQHSHKQTGPGERPVVALVGNPNVGKSAVFNLLTGKYAVVSNYPGTTVEIASGTLHLGGKHFTVIDTPGTNSLAPKSEDERVTRDILLEKPVRAVIQVADAKNLRRALTLTAQLAEIGAPVVLDLNMWDECLERGIHIEVNALAQALDVPVVCTVATERRGVRELLDSIEKARPPRLPLDYGRIIETALKKIEKTLPNTFPQARAIALMALSDDPTVEEIVTRRMAESAPAGPDRAAAESGGPHRHRHRGSPWTARPDENIRGVWHAVRAEAQREFAEPLSYVISRKRAEHADALAATVVRAARASRVTSWRRTAPVWAALPVVFFLIGYKLTELACWLAGSVWPWAAEGFWLSLVGGAAFCAAYMRHLLRGAKTHTSLAGQLGSLTMHPLFAFPILLYVLWLLYKIVGQFGAGTCVDFLQNTVFGEYILPVVAGAAARILPEENLIYQLFFSEDAGLISVGLTYSLAIVTPIVTFFFLAFGVLEDSGYLPRLAVMLDRIFKKIGLTGKAALPMVLGLGCDTMATLTTRILDTRKQRAIAVLLLALAIPCSAQLGVISGVLGRVSGAAFAMYVLVIISQLLLVGYLAAKVLPGEQPDFIIEIPPFRVPGVRNIAVKTLYRLHWFLREAVPLFLLGTFILFVLMQLGILGALETAASPLVVGVLDLPKETTAGFILGFLRRDYGVISIFEALDRVEHGNIAPADLLVALTVMTLFVPCLANFFVMIKEQGLRRAGLMVAFIFPYAFLVGGALRQVLRLVGM